MTVYMKMTDGIEQGTTHKLFALELKTNQADGNKSFSLNQYQLDCIRENGIVFICEDIADAIYEILILDRELVKHDIETNLELMYLPTTSTEQVNFFANCLSILQSFDHLTVIDDGNGALRVALDMQDFAMEISYRTVYESYFNYITFNKENDIVVFLTKADFRRFVELNPTIPLEHVVIASEHDIVNELNNTSLRLAKGRVIVVSDRCMGNEDGLLYVKEQMVNVFGFENKEFILMAIHCENEVLNTPLLDDGNYVTLLATNSIFEPTKMAPIQFKRFLKIMKYDLMNGGFY